jgi:hypothetical protein
LREALSLFYHAYLDGLSIAKIMRTKGSCRFADYYKVQFYEDSQLAWKDVQKMHRSEDDARKAFIKGKKCRVMKVTTNGRSPMP